MFETFDLLTLQQYWWILVSLLGALLVFMMFVQGGQTLFYGLAETEDEKSLIINAFGKHYKLTFTTLVTFGGAAFASFPVFYATSFGGAYFVWTAILFMFIIQAVAYEYRTKASNFLGQKTYELFLFLNGFLGPLLLGVAIATFFTGSNFIVNHTNIVDYNAAHHSIASWANNFYGLEALWNTREWAFLTNISLGFLVVFLIRILANLYIINHISNKAIEKRNTECLKYNFIGFMIFFVIFMFKLLTISGFTYTADGTIMLEYYKYLNNLLDMPFVIVMFLLGVFFFLAGVYGGYFKKCKNSFRSAGVGSILVVLTLFFLAGFNNTSFYPSLYEIQSSLTIVNASSSHYTLTVMSYVSLFIPFVLVYIVWAWRAISPEKMTKTNLKKDFDIY